MSHEIHRVVAFEKVGPLTLRVSFEDETSQVIDFQPVLKGELYRPLVDPSVFDQVLIDPEVHTLVWPGDETSQVIDFQPVLKGELYRPLVDPSVFDQVLIDPEVHTLVWPNGADFDPAILRNWPETGPELEALAKSWAVAAK